MNEPLIGPDLLNTPLCNLDITISGTMVEKAIKQLKRELKESKVKIDLHFWISDEWFCADGITGVAIPFYLLSDELKELEREKIGFVEGETFEWCLKVLRHEVAHAIDNAYQLRDCPKREEIFGSSKVKYPTEYTRKPYSKKYVIHLSNNYAQSHPEEDWAETFAVWLDPNSNWREIYKDWPALKKLEFVDKKMKSLNSRKRITNVDTLDEISTLSLTVKSYLNKKAKNFNKYKAPLFGRNLNRIFATGTKVNANQFLKSKEREICQKVAKNTNQYHYIVRDVFKELKKECKTKGLTLRKSSRETKKEVESLLISKTYAYLKQGKNKVIM
jgi:hypothetical protein